MNRIVLIILNLIYTNCFIQHHTTPIGNWKSYSFPVQPETLLHDNCANNNWVVYECSGMIHANCIGYTPVKYEIPFQIKPFGENEERKMRGTRKIQKVDDGYLIEFWRGEMGGTLYWFSDDGLQHYQVSIDLIVQFLERNNKIYAIEGIEGMSSYGGSILEIKKVNHRWITSDYLILPFTPYAADVDSKNNFVIITTYNLVSIDKNKKVDTLIKKGFWGGLHPTSLIIKEDIAFVGMRHGVFRFNLLNYKYDWLMPD